MLLLELVCKRLCY